MLAPRSAAAILVHVFILERLLGWPVSLSKVCRFYHADITTVLVSDLLPLSSNPPTHCLLRDNGPDPLSERDAELVSRGHCWRDTQEETSPGGGTFIFLLLGSVVPLPAVFLPRYARAHSPLASFQVLLQPTGHVTVVAQTLPPDEWAPDATAFSVCPPTLLRLPGGCLLLARQLEASSGPRHPVTCIL